ncbi:MAG: acetyl-CoA carboxylase biotin carboxyl carrier protein [Betaproteobacteria bacterium]|nr:acetyl-CoA carboxylase biotin carboxyl carrier protein [Betaproteobacteria bacterium]
MELTHDDVRQILKIIDDAAHLEELELVHGDFRLHVRRHGAVERAMASAAPVPGPAQAAARAAQAKTAAAPVPGGMVAIRAPMLGTFYRAPSPGEKPFVEVGQKVKAGETVCLIEVMKLFNSINAGVDGTIAQILADNAALVEYNQVLILIEPEQK